jgi:hypothetical protein
MGAAAMAVAAPRASITDVSWRAPDEMSFSEWLEYGQRLGVMGRSAGWWIGDWLCYGNHVFGERYVRASRITGYDAQTLMNMAYVASRFDASRRRGKLSWSHHAEIAAMEPEEQDHWLALAEKDRLSVRCMRESIRRERLRNKAAEQPPAPEPHGDDPDMVCPECGHRFLTAGES